MTCWQLTTYHNQLIHEKVPFIKEDTTLSPHIEQIRQLVADGSIKRAVEETNEISE